MKEKLYTIPMMDALRAEDDVHFAILKEILNNMLWILSLDQKPHTCKMT